MPHTPLSVADLHERRKKLAAINHETYKKLYAICTNQILRLQDVRPPVDTCSYTVPEHILTRPPYKRHHAMRYIKDKLERYGFTVTARDQSTLDISWARPKKKKKKSTKRPVAPVVPAARPSKPKKTPPKPTSLAEMAAAAEQRMQRLQSMR